ncbi:hypothetical protein [Williamsia sp. M5A3_1d]
MSTTHIRDEAEALGHLGDAALTMMRSVFYEHTPRFPGLDSAHEVDDLVNDFFEAKGAGYANAVTAVPDDGAARRLTSKWVERWLIDQVRKRPWGALRNRLEKRLERSNQFATSALAHHWTLADGEDTDLLIEKNELRAIAASAPVEVAPASGDGSVRLGRKGQLEEMLRRVLTAAGRLHISDLTDICAHRFPSLLENTDAFDATVEMDWDIIEETVPGHDGTATSMGKHHHEHRAAQLLPTLTARDRTVIRFLDNPLGLANELGVGRSSAYSLIAQLRARLIETAGDAERGREVVAALIGLVLDDAAVVPSLDDMSMEGSNAN